jgi:hypothetical protein
MAVLMRNAALFALGVAAGCFQSDFLAGLPCSDDSECGDLKCEDGFCGGSGSQSATEDASTSAEGPTTTEDPTVDAETTQTSIDPDTTDADTSDSGVMCPPECPCTAPTHEPCDADANSLVLALGLSCPGEGEADVTQIGSVAGRTTSTQIGGFTAREGDRFAILGSGLVDELTNETPVGDLPNAPTFCNDDQGAFDVGTLPPPMTSTAAPASCDDPEVVGMGLDCSGTLDNEIVGEIEDYSELTIGITVPEDVRSFSFEFAFSTLEYPSSVGGAFNDIFVAWLVSEAWTGNVAFDGDDAISVNSNFLIIRDDLFVEPMFAGTCLRGHASTGWLTTTAPVVPGEQIELVFAVFDQVDSAVDSFVFLDAFQWNCSPIPVPETHS